MRAFEYRRETSLQIVQHVECPTPFSRNNNNTGDISDVNRYRCAQHERRFRLRHLYFHCSCVFPVRYVMLAFDELNAPCNCWWRGGVVIFMRCWTMLKFGWMNKSCNCRRKLWKSYSRFFWIYFKVGSERIFFFSFLVSLVPFNVV